MASMRTVGAASEKSSFPEGLRLRLASCAGAVYKGVMSLKPLRIMTVGRPHAPFWKDAAAHYLERLARFRQVTDTIIRDSDPSLPVGRRVEEEGKRILAAIAPQDIVVCLDEKGRSMTSREFSRFLEGMSFDATQTVLHCRRPLRPARKRASEGETSHSLRAADTAARAGPRGASRAALQGGNACPQHALPSRLTGRCRKFEPRSTQAFTSSKEQGRPPADAGMPEG